MRCPCLFTLFSSHVRRQQSPHGAKISMLYSHISITDAQQLRPSWLLCPAAC